MSKKTSSSQSLKSLKDQCEEITLNGSDRILLVTAPDTESTLSAALLCRAAMRTRKAFHVSFEEPVINIDSINSFRTEHAASDIFFVGFEITGKKKLKKGKSYPIFIGGSSESEQVSSLTLGDAHTVAASAYVLAQEQLTVSDYELQMAAAASIVYDKSVKSPKKISAANKGLLKKAIDENIIEERRGVKLFGFNFVPLDEVLLFSIRPYIKDLSGTTKASEVFLNNADVPVTKMRDPISSLSKSEITKFTQHLTSLLLNKMDSNLLPFGLDYILTHENETSPLRHLSGIEAIADTVWARQELGAAMSIWIGDRGRALRMIKDTYMTHCKDVISAVQRLETKMKSASSEVSTMVELTGTQDELLTDIGRVVLQAEIVNPDRPLAISNENSCVIIWTHRNVYVNQIISTLRKQNLNPTTTSLQSLKFDGLTDEEKTKILEQVKSYTEKKR